MPGGSEDSLITRIARGDRAAFAALVETHVDAVTRYARSITRNPELADEAVQEAFLATYRGAGAFRGESSDRTWLLGITRRQALKAIRRRAGAPDPAAMVDVFEEESLGALALEAGFAEDDPETAVAAAECRKNLYDVLDRLPPPDREILVLRELEGLTAPEAAVVLGIGVDAVKSRLHRARLKLMGAVRSGGGDV